MDTELSSLLLLECWGTKVAQSAVSSDSTEVDLDVLEHLRAQLVSRWIAVAVRELDFKAEEE